MRPHYYDQTYGVEFLHLIASVAPKLEGFVKTGFERNGDAI